MHMFDQEIKFGSFTLGPHLPHLPTPNIRDLLLLLFYPTVSLDFGRCLISELTIHSSRMVNQPSLCTHTRLNAMLLCIWDASMPHNIWCIISNSWHENFIHHVNISTSMHRHKIFTHCMLFNYPAITQKIFELGPQSNEAIIRPQPLKHATIQTK